MLIYKKNNIVTRKIIKKKTKYLGEYTLLFFFKSKTFELTLAQLYKKPFINLLIKYISEKIKP